MQVRGEVCKPGYNLFWRREIIPHGWSGPSQKLTVPSRRDVDPKHLFSDGHLRKRLDHKKKQLKNNVPFSPLSAGFPLAPGKPGNPSKPEGPLSPLTP